MHDARAICASRQSQSLLKGCATVGSSKVALSCELQGSSTAIDEWVSLGFRVCLGGFGFVAVNVSDITVWCGL